MLEIYNSKAVTKNERFLRAIIAGVVSAIVLGLFYGVISRRIVITFQIFYIGLGYAIGMAIQTVGRGVQQRFSVLGAICAAVCFLIADIMQYFGTIGFIPSIFPYALITVIQMNFAFSVNTLLALLFKISGMVAAYQYSRII